MRDYEFDPEPKKDDPRPSIGTIFCLNIAQILFFGVWAGLFGYYLYNLDPTCTDDNLRMLGKVFFYLNAIYGGVAFIAGAAWILIRLSCDHKDIGEYLLSAEVFTVAISGVFVIIFGWTVQGDSPEPDQCQGIYNVLMVYLIIYTIVLGVLIIVGIFYGILYLVSHVQWRSPKPVTRSDVRKSTQQSGKKKRRNSPAKSEKSLTSELLDDTYNSDSGVGTPTSQRTRQE